MSAPEGKTIYRWFIIRGYDDYGVPRKVEITYAERVEYEKGVALFYLDGDLAYVAADFTEVKRDKRLQDIVSEPDKEVLDRMEGSDG